MASEKSIASNSAEIIGCNNDLLMEIFVFLPSTSLTRFQSVNRQWQSIILSPSFYQYHINHQLRRHKCHPSIVLYTPSSRDKDRQVVYFNSATKVLTPFSVNMENSVHMEKILQSSHGLLLLKGRRSNTGRVEYYVYNPMTRRLRNLFDESTCTNAVTGLCLAIDSSGISARYYKVGCIMNTVSDQYRFQVYNSVTHTWNVIGKPFTMKFDSRFFDGIYFNNMIYWIRITTGVLMAYGGMVSRGPAYVQTVCTDLENGIYSIPESVSTPTIHSGRIHKKYIMESNGHIHCVSMYIEYRGKKSLLVYEMSDDNTHWVEKYSADLSWITSYRANVVGISSGVNEDEFLVWIHIPGKIVSYRFSDERVDVIELRTNDGFEVLGDYGCHFIESLASV